MNDEFDRLAILADALESPIVGASRFDLHDWFRGIVPATLDQLPECGAAADAIGVACLIREFNVLGFRLEHFGVILRPIFGEWPGWYAVEEFFGLSDEEAHYLFDLTSYAKSNDPLLVARRIRRFIAKAHKNA